jgi:hypothetical protein
MDGWFGQGRNGVDSSNNSIKLMALLKAWRWSEPDVNLQHPAIYYPPPLNIVVNSISVPVRMAPKLV